MKRSTLLRRQARIATSYAPSITPDPINVLAKAIARHCQCCKDYFAPASCPGRHEAPCNRAQCQVAS